MLLTLMGSAVLVVAGAIVVVLSKASTPLWSTVRPWDFVRGEDWDPILDSFGALPFIYGTLVTSAIAMVVALPVSLGLAVFLLEMAPRKLRPVVTFAIEMLASIPSVVYGLWALFVLVPWLRESAQPFLAKTLGFLPLFSGPRMGIGHLAAGLVLAVMILPTLASVSIDVLRTVPRSMIEGAYALGATRWQAITGVLFPYAKAGILGAALLGLGRALGETMAVTMVIGNQPVIRASLFSPGYSLSSVIANEFAEATGPVHVGALAGLALVLLGVTLLLNALARMLMHAVSGQTGSRKR